MKSIKYMTSVLAVSLFAGKMSTAREGRETKGIFAVPDQPGIESIFINITG